MWVPVTVEDDDGVSCGKVHTKATGTCRQKETKVLQKYILTGNTEHEQIHVWIFKFRW